MFDQRASRWRESSAACQYVPLASRWLKSPGANVLEALVKRVALPDLGRRRRGGEIVQVERPLVPVPHRLVRGPTRVCWVLRLDIDGRS
jgi:hypothetical protein